jgi:hypothetical protein
MLEHFGLFAAIPHAGVSLFIVNWLTRMLNQQVNKIDYHEVMIYSDQPQTCNICGARTEIILDLSHTKNKSQVHQCLNAKCCNRFVVEADNDIDNRA